MVRSLREFVIYGAAALAAAVVVTYAYSGLVHGAAAIDWETSVRLALILGIVQAVAAWRHGPKGPLS